MEDVSLSVAARFLPALFYMGFIFWMSSQTLQVPLPIPEWLSWDKLLHACEYGLLGFLLMLGVRPLVERAWLQVAIVTALGLAWGVSDEFHQSFVPGRNGNDLGDMSADLIGSALGAIAFLLLRRVTATLRKKELEPT
jgi:VanZ family protein